MYMRACLEHSTLLQSIKIDCSVGSLESETHGILTTNKCHAPNFTDSCVIVLRYGDSLLDYSSKTYYCFSRSLLLVDHAGNR